MSSVPLFWVGNRNPSISETITSNGAPVDLTTSTARFRMRPVGGGTALTVDAPVSNPLDATGFVRYDWAAVDVDTAGFYLVWWQVTTSGKTQDVAEAVIEIREHTAGSPPVYVELEQLKGTAELTGQTFADADILTALRAASRGIDDALSRRFYLDTDATSVRYYTPESTSLLIVDDVAVVTSVAVDRTGAGTYSEAWTTTNYIPGPYNAVADGRPYEWLEKRGTSGLVWPCGVPAGVKVTGQFGWATVPPQVEAATKILATKLLVRMREAPLGFVVAGGLDAAVVARIARTDPDVYWLISDLDRKRPFL